MVGIITRCDIGQCGVEHVTATHSGDNTGCIDSPIGEQN